MVQLKLLQAREMEWRILLFAIRIWRSRDSGTQLKVEIKAFSLLPAHWWQVVMYFIFAMKKKVGN